MRLLFIILSTKANRSTRQLWQCETWLQNVDYVYLDEDENDTYDRVAHKYVAWLWANELKHDWYFFCDDDTWVYVDRLKDVLRPTPNKIMTGFKGGEFLVCNTIARWCSGGAGIGISKPLLLDIQAYVKGDPIITTESDTSLGVWAAQTGYTLIHNSRFRPQHPQHESNRHVKNAITYHYCSQDHFYKLKEGRL